MDNVVAAIISWQGACETHIEWSMTIVLCMAVEIMNVPLKPTGI